MTKIFMTGGDGYLGRYLQTLGISKLECDVREPKEVRQEILTQRPDIILHLAAKTNVDWCEVPANENEAIQTNVRGTFNVAESAEEVKCGVVLLSSDHVFSGKSWFRYKETSSPSPVNFYGMTKLSAESLRKVFHNLKVVRSSPLFDVEKLIAANGSKLQYPTFLKRSFLHRNHFAELLIQYAERFNDLPAVMHLCGRDTVSWADFMQDVIGNDMQVERRDREIQGPAPRGHNLAMDISLSKEWGFPQFSYKDGLKLL